MPTVRYSSKVFQPGTDIEIDAIKAGQDFDLAVLVQDLRPILDGRIRGVFAAYCDLMYDKQYAAIRCAEVQTLTIISGRGQLVLAMGTRKTAPIEFNQTSVSGRMLTARNIQIALNTLLGARSVEVALTNKGYEIRFVGFYDVDLPSLTTNLASAKITETIKGNPEYPSSFIGSFRFSPTYKNGKVALNRPDRIENLGSFAEFDAPGSEPIEVVRCRMKAKLPQGVVGAMTGFRPDFTTIEKPMYDTLVYGNIAAVPPEGSYVPASEIDVSAATLKITT